MRNPPGDPDPPEGGQHLVMGLAHMQDHRQPGIPRDHELRLEQGLLAGAVKPGDKIIQTDLANGDRTPAGHQRLECRQVRFPVLLQIGRSDWLSSPEDAETLKALLRSEHGKLIFYDAGHKLPPQFAADAARWLIERLR